MLAQPPYESLYYVEGHDVPFTDFAAAQAESLVDPENPLALWEIEPMTLLLTMALHSEVARLLGLYYIDTTADPNTEYDYRVTGYWADRMRSYVFDRLSRPRTLPLPTPDLQKAKVIPRPARKMPNGDYWPTEAGVGLAWAPPTLLPSIDLTAEDGILSLMHVVERRDLGPAVGAPLDTPGPFEQMTEPNEDGDFLLVDPVILTRRDDTDAPDQWPEYFVYDNWVDYRTYEYRILGLDIFGRASLPSNSRNVAVLDTVRPMPPTSVEARIYQRNDPATQRLVPDLRDSLFPPGEDNDFAIRISWLWPDFLALRVPDVKEFQVFFKFQDFDSFSEPASQNLWPETTNWDGPLVMSIPVTDALSSLPDRYYEVPDDLATALVPPSSYYETIVTDLPDSITDHIDANDDAPVIYGFMTVASVDHDPFNNIGPAASPTQVFTRDFEPPAAPVAPSLLEPAGEIDRSGNAQLTVRVLPADKRYTYDFFRVRSQRLVELEPTGSLPAVCTPDTGEVTAELQVTAAEHPELFGGLSAVPSEAHELGATNWVCDFTDTLDGTISQRFFYVAVARDPAGNVSPFSCPSIAIEILDGMPPRPPVVTKVLGVEGGVALTWAANPEADLERYLVYRTTEFERANSKRKMTLVLAANGTGIAVHPTATVSNATKFLVGADQRFMWTDTTSRAGHDYFFRLVATDIAGNASLMSDVVSARAFDTMPPAAPDWPTIEPVRWTTDASGAPVIQLSWQALVGEDNPRFLIQRRTQGSLAWIAVGGWMGPSTTYVDSEVAPGRTFHYRVRAMDAQGNRGGWSAIQMSP